MKSYNIYHEANLASIVKLMLTFCFKAHIINIVVNIVYIEMTPCLSSSAG